MNSKKTQNPLPLNESLDSIKEVDYCKVNKASVEIMLERFCNGIEIDFPFSQ